MTEHLVDSFGRQTLGIRISLTDRCNFDCFYCHNEGLGDTRGPREPADNEMTSEHVLRLGRIAHSHGIKEFKLTGGEPMLRADLEKIVEGISALGGTEVSMTTNGTFLPGRAKSLVESGLERVNVSMDSLDPESFREITEGNFYRVLEGVDAALNAGLDPVKLNFVLADRTVEHLPRMVEHVVEKNSMRLQIIEYMPELVGGEERRVNLDDVREYLTERADEIVQREMHNRKRYIVGDSYVEIVDPVGNPEFCSNCHRLRVTHEGKLKGCLNRNDNLVSTIGSSEEELHEAFERVVEERVPYYGEYMIKEGDEWVRNPEYVETVEVKDEYELPMIESPAPSSSD